MIKVNLSFLAKKFFHPLGSSLLIFSGFSALHIAHSGITIAQTSPLIMAELPTPPINQMNDFSSDEGEVINIIPYFEDTPTMPSSQPRQQEYNFQAPQPNYPSHSTDKVVQFYRVEVIVQEVRDTKESLLSQVKKVEPFAYLERNEGVIYAGLFPQQQQAQQRVQQLTTQGLSARIVPVSSSYEIPVQ